MTLTGILQWMLRLRIDATGLVRPVTSIYTGLSYHESSSLWKLYYNSLLFIVLHMLEPISEYLTDGRKSVARINSTQVHHYGSYR